MKIDLTAEESEVLEAYLFRKACRLEESGLTDSKCYRAMQSIRHKIRHGTETQA